MQWAVHEVESIAAPKVSQLRLFRRTTANKLSIRVKVNQKFTFFQLLSLWTLLKWFWWGCHRGHNCVNLLIDFNQAAISRVNLVALSKWRPPSNTKVKCNMDWIEWTTSLKQSNFLLPSEEEVKTYSPPGPSEGSSWRSLSHPCPPCTQAGRTWFGRTSPGEKTISYEIANSHSIICLQFERKCTFFVIFWCVEMLLEMLLLVASVGCICFYLVVFRCIVFGWIPM